MTIVILTRIIEMQLNPKLQSIEIERGWGNGYVGVDVKHPWFQLDYGEVNEIIEYNIHGGLTFAGTMSDNNQTWWFGFDTGQIGDNRTDQDRLYVTLETMRLAEHAARAVPDYSEVLVEIPENCGLKPCELHKKLLPRKNAPYA